MRYDHGCDGIARQRARQCLDAHQVGFRIDIHIQRICSDGPDCRAGIVAGIGDGRDLVTPGSRRQRAAPVPEHPFR